MLKFRSWAGTVFGALLGAAVASSINSLSSSREASVKIIDGRAYVSVRDLQSFTRVNVNLQTKRASFPPSSPYANFNNEHFFGSVAPFDYASFGGIQAVRRKMSQLQQISPSNRTLVRYEIVSSAYADGPQTVITGFMKDYRPSFAVNAVLYWADTTRLQTFLGITNGPNGQVVTLKANARPATRVEVRQYIVSPGDVQSKPGGITFSPKNWNIVSEQVLKSAPRISLASVYDLSQITVNNDHVRQGVDYPELNME